MKIFDLFFGKMIDRRIAEYQNDLITKHCDEVENIYRRMRGWRHDYHNHIQTMIALLEQENAGEDSEVRKYLLNLNDDLKKVDTVIKTGNVMVDAILNSKLSMIQSKSVKASAKAVVPPKLLVSEIDLCTIIGNLLDNALEACLRQPDETEQFIRVYIGVLKGQLYISVSNSMSGMAKKSGKRYISEKSSESHGFGLLRVDSIVRKYGGYINRQNEEGVFATEIMLPM